MKSVKRKIKLFIPTLTALLIATSCNNNDMVNDNNTTIEYDIDYLRDKIFSSIALTKEEKEYLYNSDFIEDILPIINSSNYLRNMYDTYFYNISIEAFNKEYEKYDSSLGYYSTGIPNTLFIKDYDGINEDNKDTIAHEFIHLCQDSFEHNLITEASAEIISYEYFNDTSMSSYATQVKLLKELMEIIGSYPIWYYNFTGDFSLIEKMVKPYLNDNDYNIFIDCLSFSYDDYTSNINRFNKLEEILDILYKNIYGENIKDNVVINLLSRNDNTLVRFYFNKRLNESYYFDYKNANYETIALDTAINNKMVFIFCSKEIKIDYETAKKIIASCSYSIKRKIDTKSINYTLLRSHNTGNKEYISAIINGVRYENIDIDELIDKGVVNATYYMIDYKYLSADEYIHHKYGDDYEIIVSHNSDDIINDDYTVYGKVPLRIDLPSIFDEKLKSLS